MKKAIAFVLALLVALSFLGACTNDKEEAVHISFKAATSVEYLRSLEGKKVSISGYMASLTPVDGSFMYLMNMPYQNCPYCVPNTSQLSNTLAVYPKNGDSFSYTTQAIRVTGTLVFAKEGEFFTDAYTYEYGYKLVDADYVIIRDTELSEELKAWQAIAQSGIVDEMYNLFDYVYFLCCWNSAYTVKAYTDEDGNTIPRHFMYADETIRLIDTPESPYCYDSQMASFAETEATINKLSKTAYTDLTDVLAKLKTHAEKARSELLAGNYTSSWTYVEYLGYEQDLYTWNSGDDLYNEWYAIYLEFSNWLGSWEM